MQDTTQDEPKFFPVNDQLMIFAIREEGGRIYVDKDDYMEYLKGNRAIKTASASSFIPYPVTDDGEVVLYDFNMQVGDEFPEAEGRESVFVKEIEMIECQDNTERKLFHLSNGCDIIEGIGAVNGAGFLAGYLDENVKWFSIQYLCGFFKNIDMKLSHEEGLANSTTICAFSYEYALDHSKDILDHYSEIIPLYSSTNQDAIDIIFDLQGRRLTARPQRGLYIRDGKKYVVKE